jgi:carbon monoxide dehydrogenase subunit G
LQLEHEFEVSASPGQTLELLLDAERVVPCMPGARLLEVVDDRSWKSELGIKLGPVGMQFLADVRMLERDDAAGTVRLGVSARDTRGKGGAEATVDSALHAADGGGTRVAMTTDLRFSGQAAQLGRPGVVKDVSNKLVGQFAECIRGQLSAAPEESAQAVQEAHKPISGLSLAVSALVGAVKRLFGFGREKGETT